MTKEALNKQDAAFSRRIARRDESVVTEIQLAYAGSLRRWLEGFRGPHLDDHDIDDVVAQATDEVWTKFDPARGSTVRAFFFGVAKRRFQDRLRRNSRRRRAELEAARIVDATAENEPMPEQVLADRESNARLSRMVEHAVDHLTDRQRKAFNRRFAVGGGNHWAKRLEEETGTPSKQWRKASAEGLSKIREYLIDHGVQYSREEGRYEVA